MWTPRRNPLGIDIYHFRKHRTRKSTTLSGTLSSNEIVSKRSSLSLKILLMSDIYESNKGRSFIIAFRIRIETTVDICVGLYIACFTMDIIHEGESYRKIENFFRIYDYANRLYCCRCPNMGWPCVVARVLACLLMLSRASAFTSDM